MPIYFGVDPPRTQRGNQTRVSEALEKKGIKLVRIAPSDLTVLCFPVVATPVLGMIIVFFSALLYALAKGKILGNSVKDMEVTESHPNPFPINLPPLAVALRSSNDSGHDALAAAGFEMVTIQGKDVYLNGAITKEQLRSITENPSLDLNRTCYAPVGFCNLSSMSVALDLIALFSFASQLLGLGIHGDASGSEEADDYDEILGDDGEEMDADDITDQAKMFNNGTHFRRLFAKASSARVSASFVRSRQAFFTPDALPKDYTGFLFRYLRELAIDDPKTVPDFVHKYLLKNLGSNEAECVQGFLSVRSAWGNLRDTTFGHELSHIAKCMFLTLELNGSIYPLFDAGFYEGCVIRCSNAVLAIGGTIVESASSEELARDIETIATHKRTLDQIAALAIREGALAELGNRIRQSSSMVELRSLLVESPISESVKEGILSVAPYLRFPARSWSINAKSLEDMCKIAESLVNLKVHHPISYRALLSMDSFEVAMSCFDDRRCPSLISPGGTAIDLKGRVPGAPTSNNPSGERSRGKQRISDAPWTFTIRRTSFEEAVSDLRKVVYNAEARSTSSSAARGTGAVTFRKQQFVNLFGQLQKLVSARGKTSTAPVIAMESNAVIAGKETRVANDSGDRPAKKMRL